MIMKMIKLFYVLVLSVGIYSCQKNSDDSQMNTQCVNNPALCNGQIYQQNNGFYPYTNYGYNYGGYNQGYPNYSGGIYYTGNSGYLCNCPTGSIPTYNSYGGLGCVNNAYMGGSAYAYFGLYGNGATNNQWMNIPQISNYTGYNQSSCYNGVVQSCLVNQSQTTCSAGYTCRATTAQSNLGLCVSNSTQNTQGSGYR